VKYLAVLGAMAVALIVSAILRNKRGVEAPTQGGFDLPTQLDRADFATSAPWMVVVFSSATCDACSDMVAKARVMESSEVAVFDVSYQDSKSLHEKYKVEAVPSTVIVDKDGVVHAGFLGPIKSQDLWAAVAEAREPGSTPPAHEHRHE
jgi:hypothetical protein